MTDVLIFLAGTGAVLAALTLRSRLWGFWAQRPADYAATAPRFDLREHLSGPLLCEGVIYGPTGRVTSRFVADMQASWQGNVGTMTEQFRYDSGARQSRRWVLTLGNDGTIEAAAPDVVGTGQGRQAGAAVQLKYRLRLPEDAGGHVLNAVDWMYLTENGTILNRSQFRKYGIKVAELVATMRRKEAG
jgi:hypothetical protein